MSAAAIVVVMPAKNGPVTFKSDPVGFGPSRLREWHVADDVVYRLTGAYLPLLRRVTWCDAARGFDRLPWERPEPKVEQPAMFGGAS